MKKLVELSISDLDKIIELENSVMNTEYTYPFTKEELKKYFENGKYIVYAFLEGDKIIAKVGFLENPEKPYWELDVSVSKKYQGQGFGTEILKLSLKKFLDLYPERKVFLEVHPKNPAKKLYDGLGFVEYEKRETEHGPRIVMDYKNN